MFVANRPALPWRKWHTQNVLWIDGVIDEYQKNLRSIYTLLEQVEDTWIVNFREIYKLWAENINFEDEDLILDVMESIVEKPSEVNKNLRGIIEEIYKLLYLSYGKGVSVSMIEQSKSIIDQLNRATRRSD